MTRTKTNDHATAAPASWSPTGTLTIDTVAAHWADVQAHLGTDRPLQIDLAAVDRVDTAGAQLLVQVRRVARGIGQVVHVHGLAMPADTRRLLGILEDAAPAAQATPVLATGQEG